MILGDKSYSTILNHHKMLAFYIHINSRKKKDLLKQKKTAGKLSKSSPFVLPSGSPLRSLETWNRRVAVVHLQVMFP
jgi:hypothetical protein